MAYPTLPTSYNSDEARPSGRQLDRATNGAPRVRDLNDRDRRVFTLVHPSITDAEKNSVEAFYVAHKTSSFAYVSVNDGVSYTCIFGATAPAYKRVRGATLWDVTVSLVEL